jgi:HEAT repeat protein
MQFFGPPNVEKMKARGDVAGLIKSLTYKKDSFVRDNAAMGLGAIGDPRAIEPLMVAIKDEDYRVCKSAFWALGKIGYKTGNPEAIQAITAALKDEMWHMRFFAAWVIGKMNWNLNKGDIGAWIAVAERDWEKAVRLGSSSVNPLIVALNDRDPVVCKAAAESLGKIGDPRAINHLSAILSNESLQKQDNHSSVSLSDDRDAGVIVYIDTEKYGNLNVKDVVAEALRKIGTPHAG